VAGAIDLVYRDPATGELVVVDYKTDRIETKAEIAERARVYAAQGAEYQRALREALRLDAPPRFELWFLYAGRRAPIDTAEADAGVDFPDGSRAYEEHREALFHLMPYRDLPADFEKKLIPDCGHLLLFELTAEFLAVVTRFLAEVDPSRPTRSEAQAKRAARRSRAESSKAGPSGVHRAS
jgi:hypothetical protein